MAFPLLELPYLALRKVLQYFEFFELLDLSLFSSKCKGLVKSIKRRHRYIGINLYSNNGRPMLCFITEEKTLIRQWKFNSDHFKQGKRKKRGEERPRIDSRRIGGVDVQTLVSPNKLLESPEFSEVQMRVIFNYLQEILNNLPINTIDITSHQENQTLAPKYLGIENCEKMEVHGSNVPIPDEHLRYILEKVKITKKLVLRIPINPTFRQDSARISTEELEIGHAHWMSRDTFLSLDCQRITLKNWGLRTVDFEDFVQRWLDSDDTCFIFLRITFTPPRERFDYSKFQAKPWDSNVRGRYFGLSSSGTFRNYKLDCQHGWDVIRKDSLMATIGFFCQGIMYFVVWHERFPALAELT